MLTISKVVFLVGVTLVTGSTKEAWLNAISSGRPEEVSRLISGGASINQILDITRNTPLIKAVDLGHYAVVETLLLSGADVDQAGQRGRTPLMVAASNGNAEIVSILIKNKAKVDLCDDLGDSALNLAASWRWNHNVVRILLASGADVDQAGQRGRTPLMTAVESRNVEIVSVLIENNARVDLCDNAGNFALHIAARGMRGGRNVVRMLLSSGADVDQAGQRGRTPLMVAASNGNTELVSLLVSRNARVDQADVDGRTPLMVAVVNGNVKIVSILLENKANLGLLDFNSILDCPTAVFLKLVDAGFNINAVSVDGETPLMHAVRDEWLEKVLALIASGANVNQVTERGTALITAVSAQDSYMIKPLMIAGAEIPEDVEVINRMMTEIRWIATSDPMSDILTKRQRLTAAFLALKNNKDNNLFDHEPFRALFVGWTDARIKRVSQIVQLLVDLGCEAFAFNEIFSHFLTSDDFTRSKKLGIILSFLVSPLSPRTTIFQGTDKTEIMQFNKKTLHMFVYASHVQGLESTIDTMFAAYEMVRDRTRASGNAVKKLTDEIIGSILQFVDGEFGTFSEFAKLLKEFTLRTLI